jgi:AcrR family transcriptional regulator
MEPLEPTYRVPRQKRSQESLERILEATEELIREEGLEALTIGGMVARAGLSVGAFYARFPDKTALLHAAQECFHNRLEPIIRQEMVAETRDCATLAEAVEVAFEVLIRNVTGERELSRAFMAMSVFDPVMRARGELVNRQRREALTQVLLAYHDEIGHPDPVLAIDLAYGIYAAVVRGRLIFGLEHELYYGITNQTIYGELKRALALYLQGERSADPARKDQEDLRP